MRNKQESKADLIATLVSMVVIGSLFVMLLFVAEYYILAVLVGLILIGIPITIIVGIATNWITATRTSASSWRIRLTSDMQKELAKQKEAEQIMLQQEAAQQEAAQQEKMGSAEPMLEQVATLSVYLCPCCGAALDANCKICPDCHTTLG